MKNEAKQNQDVRKPYVKPKVIRWGKLRDLTHTGSSNGEPATKAAAHHLE